MIIKFISFRFKRFHKIFTKKYKYFRSVKVSYSIMNKNSNFKKILAYNMKKLIRNNLNIPF